MYDETQPLDYNTFTATGDFPPDGIIRLSMTSTGSGTYDQIVSSPMNANLLKKIKENETEFAMHVNIPYHYPLRKIKDNCDRACVILLVGSIIGEAALAIILATTNNDISLMIQPPADAKGVNISGIFSEIFCLIFIGSIIAKLIKPAYERGYCHNCFTFFAKKSAINKNQREQEINNKFSINDSLQDHEDYIPDDKHLNSLETVTQMPKTTFTPLQT